MDLLRVLTTADVIKNKLDNMMALDGCKDIPEVVSLLREAKEKISEAARNISEISGLGVELEYSKNTQRGRSN